MSEVKRYYVGDAGLVEGESLGRITVVLVADFDRVTAERDALQLLLNDRDEQLHTLDQSRRAHFDNGVAAERRAEELTGLLRKVSTLRGTLDQHGLLEEVDAALVNQSASTIEACQYPQSCTTRCDCDIPDFSPGNGNKARRRAESLLGFKIVEDPTLAPGEMKLVQPASTSAFSDANEPHCPECFARGCNGECSGDGAMGD